MAAPGFFSAGRDYTTEQSRKTDAHNIEVAQSLQAITEKRMQLQEMRENKGLRRRENEANVRAKEIGVEESEIDLPYRDESNKTKARKDKADADVAEVDAEWAESDKRVDQEYKKAVADYYKSGGKGSGKGKGSDGNVTVGGKTQMFKTSEKQFQTLLESSDLAQSQGRTLMAAKALLTASPQDRAQSGFFEGLKTVTGQVMEGVGMDASIITNVKDQETLSALFGSMTTDAILRGGRAISNEDANRIEKVFPNLRNTPEGNYQLIRILEAQNEYTVTKRKFIAELMRPEDLEDAAMYAQAEALFEQRYGSDFSVVGLKEVTVDGPNGQKKTALKMQTFNEFKAEAKAFFGDDITEIEIIDRWRNTHQKMLRNIKPN